MQADLGETVTLATVTVVGTVLKVVEGNATVVTKVTTVVACEKRKSAFRDQVIARAMSLVFNCEEKNAGLESSSLTLISRRKELWPEPPVEY